MPYYLYLHQHSNIFLSATVSKIDFCIYKYSNANPCTSKLKFHTTNERCHVRSLKILRLLKVGEAKYKPLVYEVLLLRMNGDDHIRLGWNDLNGYE